MTTSINRFRSFLHNVRGRGVSEETLNDELEAFVAMVAAEKVAGGMDEAAALRAARVELGSMEQVKEQVREARSGYHVASLLQDIRYTARLLVRSPGYTMAIVLTLALGIGATTAIFTVVRAVLLRDLPYEDADNIVRVWPSNPTQEIIEGTTSHPEFFQDWNAEKRAFSSLAAYYGSANGAALTGVGEAVRLSTVFVTEDFFATLGVRPLLGRAITPAEHAEGANRIAMISHAAWMKHFGGDRNVVGRTIQLDGEPFTLVGVLEPSMQFPSRTAELFVPLSLIGEDGSPRIRENRWLQMIARLQPGVTVEDAHARAAALSTRLAADHPATNATWTSAVIKPLRDDIIGPARGRLLIIFGTVMLILALGCVNIANLVLARATQRQREVAIRALIGATRARLVRQLLTESLVLSFAGGVLGLIIAAYGSAALANMAGTWLPLPEVVRPDWLVLLFAFAICIATGVGFALIPATASFTAISGTLRDGGRSNSPSARAHAMRRTFVAVQLALAVMLVAGAALFVQSFARLARVDLGYDAEHIVFARLALPSSDDPTRMDQILLAEQMAANVAGMPGVIGAGVITKHPPLRGVGEQLRVGAVGTVYANGTEPLGMAMGVSRGYFNAMGMNLLEGRDFLAQDNQSETGAVVVSATLARTVWGERSPVGQHIMIEGDPYPVVGVVSDVRFEEVDGAPTPMLYLARRIMSRSAVAIVARGTGDPAQLLGSLRTGIRAAMPDLPITEVATLQSVVDERIAAPRFLASLLTMFGVLAVLLAAIGVYGVVSYVVGQRRNEIGIRMALGAQATGIISWTIRTGMVPVAAGIAAGLVGAAALSRLIASQLFEVSTGNPATYAAVALILAAISLAATSIPALRATRVDPTQALRAD